MNGYVSCKECRLETSDGQKSQHDKLIYLKNQIKISIYIHIVQYLFLVLPTSENIWQARIDSGKLSSRLIVENNSNTKGSAQSGGF